MSPQRTEKERLGPSVPDNKDHEGQWTRGLEKGRRKPATCKVLLLNAAYREVYRRVAWK